VFFVLFRLFYVDKVKVDLNVSEKAEDELKDGVSTDGKLAQTFTFAELAAATGNFKADCFVGEGGFGKVYKGYLQKTNQVR